MAWTVEIQEQALDDMLRLDHGARRRILKYFRERLEGSENPWLETGLAFGGTVSGLTGPYATWKIRSLPILVVEAGHRKNIYD